MDHLPLNNTPVGFNDNASMAVFLQTFVLGQLQRLNIWLLFDQITDIENRIYNVDLAFVSDIEVSFPDLHMDYRKL